MTKAEQEKTGLKGGDKRQGNLQDAPGNLTFRKACCDREKVRTTSTQDGRKKHHKRRAHSRTAIRPRKRRESSEGRTRFMIAGGLFQAHFFGAASCTS